MGLPLLVIRHPGTEIRNDRALKKPITSRVAGKAESIRERWPGSTIGLFSDGTVGELAPFLQLSNVRRLTFGNPLADLLAMSRSSLLVCNGSTFSAWAAYLGNMPTIWFPTKLGWPLHPGIRDYEIESSLDEPLSRRFIQNVESPLPNRIN